MADNQRTITGVIKADAKHFLKGVSDSKKGLSMLSKSANAVGGMFGKIFSANIVSSAVIGGFNAVKSSVSELVGEMNSSSKAWQTFEGNLKAFGKSADYIADAKKEMQDYATQTIYSASDMASTFAQLEAVGVKDTKTLVKAFGGLAASAENPKQAMKSLSIQATQMAAKPKVAWADFKIMLEQAPAGISAVAKAMGKTTEQLIADVGSGKVKTQDFFEAMKKAAGSADSAFQKMATQYKTTDQAIDGLKETVSNKLQPAFKKLDDLGIKFVSSLTDGLDNINIDTFTNAIDGAMIKLKEIANFWQEIGDGVEFSNLKLSLKNVKSLASTVFDSFKNVSWARIIKETIDSVAETIRGISDSAKRFFDGFRNTGVIKAVEDAFIKVQDAYQNLVKAIGNSEAWGYIGEAIGKVVKFIADLIKVIADFISKIPPSILNAIATGFLYLISAFIGFKSVKGILSKVTGLFGLFGSKAKNVVDKTLSSVKGGSSGIVGALKTLLDGLGGFIESIGTTISTIAQGIGKGIQSIMQGIAVVPPTTFLALSVAIVAIGAAFVLMGTQGQGISQIIMAIGTAISTVILAIGAVIPQIIASFSVLFSGISTVMAGIQGIIVATGRAIGTVLQGIANVIISIGVSINLALQGVATVVDSVANGINTALQGVATVVDSVANGINTALQGVADVVRSVGESIKTACDGIGIIFEKIGGAIKMALDGVAGIIEAIGHAALNAGEGFNRFADGIVKLQGVDLLGIAGGILALGGAIAGATIASMGLGGLADGIIRLGQGMGQVASATNGVIGTIGALSSVINVICQQMNVMSNVVSNVPNIFNSMTSAVSNTMNTLLKVFNTTSIAITKITLELGKTVINNIVQGIASGVSSVTLQMIMIQNVLRTVGMTSVKEMQNIGNMIGQGLALGMKQAIGSVTASANELVRQAERAAKAKAQIHSPSRLFRDNVGRFIGEGVAIGIEQSETEVITAMDSIIDNVSKTTSGIYDVLNGNIEYSNNTTLSDNIRSNSELLQVMHLLDKALDRDIVVSVNGRELIRATGKNIDEYNVRNNRMNRLLQGVK